MHGHAAGGLLVVLLFVVLLVCVGSPSKSGDK